MELKYGFKKISGDNDIRSYRGDYSIYICDCPTGNCQLFSILYFGTALDMYATASSMKEFLRYISVSITGKKLLFVDIKSYNTTKLETVIPKAAIVFKQPYESTNDSRMVTYLININNL